MNYYYQYGETLSKDIREATVPEGAVALWSLGQACFVIKGDGGEVIVLDPYLTRSMEVMDPDTEFVREYDPPLQPADLSGAVAMLISHHHADHLDLATVQALHSASPGTRIVLPAAHRSLLSDITPSIVQGVTAHEQIQLSSFTIEAVAAAHTDYALSEHGHDLYLGYFITVNNIRIYFSGDTVVTSELIDSVRHFKPHIALLPINGRDFLRTSRNIIGNMNGREAVDFAATVGADLLIPFHYDMFPNNRDNPAHMIDYLFHHHRAQKFHMLAVGERFVYLNQC